MNKKIIICITVLLFSGLIYAEGAFVEIGNPSFFPDDFTDLVSMQIDDEGNVFVAYLEDHFYLSAAKFDGESWSDVGERKFTGGIGNIKSEYDATDSVYVSFALGKNGIPYAVFPASGSYKLHVMEYDKEKNEWKRTGKTDITEYKTSWNNIAVNSDGVPYVAFSGCTDENCQKVNEDGDNYTEDSVSVMKFDGTEWVYVGEPMFVYKTGNTYPTSNLKVLFDSKNTPYIALSYGNSDVFVMKFNGTGWNMVGDIDEMEIMSTGVLFIDREDNLYLNCYWGNDFSDPWVLEFDGGKWNKKFSSKNMGLISFNSENIPYAILSDWIEENSSISVSLGKYVNENWNIIDSFELEYSNSLGLTMKLDKNDVPFFAYVNNHQQVELLKYDTESDETKDDSDEESVGDEDSVPVNDKDSNSSGCGIVVM